MGKTILVVDDEETIREALKSVLSDEGYRVLLAANGQTGAEIALQDQPDLIISDLMMPNMSGGKMAARLENDPRTKKIPIIFLTGIVDQAEADLTGHTMAGQYLIAKPFDNNELFVMIDLALKK